MIKLSIIIPVFNEAKGIESCLQNLRNAITKDSELIVVDGGSDDNTHELALPLADQVITAGKGRAKQMNAGAQIAKGELLLFIHSDTRLPKAAFYELLNLPSLIKSQELQSHSLVWGFFPVRLSGSQSLFRVIEYCINLRSRLTSVATGDQCIFIEKTLFEKGAYQDIPLMEDVEMTKRLRHYARPKVMPHYAITSSRRWEEKGVINTVLLMWKLRLLYFLGVSPTKLAKEYA